MGNSVFGKQTNIIKVEGIIGAGKTTTIKYIAGELIARGYSVYIINECVDEWLEDGLLQKFYNDPKRYAYHFQTKAFVDKVKKFRRAFNKYYGKVDFIITERSLLSDYIFAELLHNDGMIDDMEFKHYNDWYRMWYSIVPEEFQYGLTVYLRVEPSIALQRVEERSRSGENNIKYEYERDLHTLHDDYFNIKNKYNLVWNSSKNIHIAGNVVKITDKILKKIIL